MADTPFPGIIKIMPNHEPRRSKPARSAHQKQIRFLTGLAVFISLLLVTAMFWLLNRTSLSMH